MRAAALAIGLLFVAPALAEETICTPDYYYNSTTTPPIVIAIDEARGRGSWVTRVDIETGAYREHYIGRESEILHTGTFKIINPGSQRERIDFVALDTDTALLLHISLIDEGMPFVRIETSGTVASGYCVYEYDLPK